MPNRYQKIQQFYAYCPHCGKRFTHKNVHGKKELYCGRCDFTFWLNSKPTASVVMVRKNSILLAKRGIAPYLGYWDVPGGFLDFHEEPEIGARREMKEELGITIGNMRLIGIFTGVYPSVPSQSTFNVYYYATSWKGRLSPMDDVESFSWFPISALPTRIAFDNNEKALKEFRRMWRSRKIR